MSVANAFIESILEGQRDEIEALPKEERVRYAAEIISGIQGNPAFTQSDLPLSQESADELDSWERHHTENLERRSRVWPEEHKLENFMAANPEVTAEEIDQISRYAPNRALRRERANAELERSGVILDDDLPAGDWKLGFGKDKVADLKNVLSDHFGVNVAVAKHGDNILYFDPERKKVVRANFGLASSAGHAIPLAADVIGTVAGKTPTGHVMKAVAKDTTGSGVFTTLGEAIRLSIGKATGVHDMSWDEMGTEALKVGGEAALFTGGIGSMVAAGKGVVNFWKGGIFTKEAAMRQGFNAEEADEVLRQVNEILAQGGSDKVVKSTAAQKVDDVNLTSMEAELKTSYEHGQVFRDRAAQDQAAITEASEVINKADPGYVPEPGLGTVGEVAEHRVGRRTNQAKEIVSRNKDELARQLDSIGSVDPANVGRSTRAILEAKAEAAERASDDVWANVRASGGYDEATESYGIIIKQGDESKRLKDEYYRRTSTAQTKISAGGTGAVFKDTGQKAADSVDDVAGRSNLDIANRRLEAAKAEADGTVKPKGKPEQKPQDLQDLNREISDLKRALSDAHHGKMRGTTSERDLGRVVDAMVKDRRTALLQQGKGELLEAIEYAERQTLDFHEAYTRSVVADLTARVDGVPVIKEQTFIANMLRRDNSEIEQFRNIIEDNPALLNEWKTGLAQSWKRAAFNEKERYSPDLSKKWFEDNNGALEYFFTGAEIKAMQSTGGLAKKVASQTERLKKFVDKANKKWGSGSLSRVDPEGLTKFITGGGGGWTTPIGKGVQTRISKIKYVKNITAEHPSAWRGLQNDFKANIRNTIIDPQTGNLNAGKLADMVGDSDHVKVIKEMLGTKYYEDLKVISEALSIVSKSEIRMAGSQGMKASIQAVRAGAAPPLTKRGRVLTALVTFNNKSAQKRAADALLSNTSMRETAELLSHDPWTRRFMEKSFSLGYGMPGEDE